MQKAQLFEEKDRDEKYLKAFPKFTDEERLRCLINKIYDVFIENYREKINQKYEQSSTKSI
jgi:hypothetical protein